jgi:class 3 adenylate cyclase
MLVATLYALFAGDVLAAAFRPSADYGFGVASAITFALFAFDLLASVVGKPGYFPSLFFFLDLLATISIIPDIPFIYEPFLTSVGASPDSVAVGANQASIARAGRAARAGTRAGRLVRLFKLFALVKKKEESGPKKDELEEPSMVGKKLAELTTRKVVIGVMLMVGILPFLNADNSDASFTTQFNQLDVIAQREYTRQYNGTVPANGVLAMTPLLNQSVGYFLVNQRPIMQLQLWGLKIVPNLGQDYVFNYKLTRRSTEVGRAEAISYHSDPEDLNSPSSKERPKSSAVLDQKSFAVTSAYYNIILTVFIVILLGVGAALFSRDANKLMIGPIERMVQIVRMLAEDPLARLDDSDEKKASSGEQLETSVVEAALRKIGALLQIGFGEAGAEIIGKNLASGANINPMLPGQLCKGAFGFCDIHQFAELTESLNEEIMVYVNLVAEIVHMSVKRHGGFPNKNIGDAFLLCWKTVEKVPDDQLADGALQALLDVIDETSKSPGLLAFAEYESVKKRIPGYHLHMGFGLHYGWAVEGAIGSALKIDASYLSPHVNIAARLESACRMYGVPMLLSSNLHNLLSKKMKALCRRIDRVTLKGSKEPLDLFVVDLNPPPKDSRFPGIRRYTRLFEEAIQAYLQGNWALAGDLLQTCLEAYPQDEPARVLLYYISRHNFRPDSGFKGFRELQSK